MIVTDDQYGTVVVSPVGEDGTLLDERTLPGLASGGRSCAGTTPVERPAPQKPLSFRRRAAASAY